MTESEKVKLIAFYLPQFHPIAENDQFWGKGFTEWTNVTRAQPLYPGHIQPRLPGELGFYDLRLPEISVRQAELAREYGIDGFCYHYYWFAPGKTVLDRPLQQLLQAKEPDLPFCLCWANENWTRRWDGSEQEILIKQEYTDAMAEAFIESLLPYFRDDRYIRVDGKPILLVYDVRQFEDVRKSTALWRKYVRAAGFDDVYLVRCNTFVSPGFEIDPALHGFDACVEFPPHGTHTARVPLIGGEGKVSGPEAIGRGDAGASTPVIYDHEVVVYNSITKAAPGYELVRGLFPAWDNTARKQQDATIYFGATPALYQSWLSALIDWAKRHNNESKQLVFINAWNEWAEGAVLEPDQQHGRQYLEATKNARSTQQDSVSTAVRLADMVSRSRLTANFELTIEGVNLKRSDEIICELEKVGFGDGGFGAEGFAFVRGTTPTRLGVVVFDDEQIIGSTITATYRPELAERFGLEALRSGFILYVPKYTNAKGKIRVFAFSPNGLFQSLEQSAALMYEAQVR